MDCRAREDYKEKTDASTKRGTYFHPLSPCPRRPSSPLPHVKTWPFLSKMTVWPEPHDICFTEPGKSTRTGSV